MDAHVDDWRHALYLSTPAIIIVCSFTISMLNIAWFTMLISKVMQVHILKSTLTIKFVFTSQGATSTSPLLVHWGFLCGQAKESWAWEEGQGQEGHGSQGMTYTRLHCLLTLLTLVLNTLCTFVSAITQSLFVLCSTPSASFLRWRSLCLRWPPTSGYWSPTSQ